MNVEKGEVKPVWQWLKKNRVIRWAIEKICDIIYNVLLSLKCDLQGFYRKSKNYKGKYRDLEKYQNIHKGQRCFIVATGPSLKMSDLELLKDEITFSMNSICLSLDETTWRPTYYGVQDINVFAKLENEIKAADLNTVFVSSHLAKYNDIPSKWNVYPIHYLNHYYQAAHKKVKTCFTDNIVANVYDGYSIAYSMLQLAVYMGFSEIYLLGADCNYSKDGAQHFKDYGFQDPNYLTVGEKMIYGYQVACEFAKKNNIKIYNATRGGKLEVFKRVNLEEVIAQKKVGEDYNK